MGFFCDTAGIFKQSISIYRYYQYIQYILGAFDDVLAGTFELYFINSVVDDRRHPRYSSSTLDCRSICRAIDLASGA